jgi:MFS family permease
MTALRRAGSLWCDRGFRRLWAARTISLVGSQVSALALPLVAAVYLNASTLHVSLLAAAGFLPWLLFGLFAGVLVDRSPRRLIMIWTDVARAGLLLTIPIAAACGVLSVGQIAFVAFAVGALTVLSDTASTAFLPSLVGHKRLTEGNAKLSAGTAATTIAGPSAAGALLQAFSAPFAVAADALSFLVSAWLIRGVRCEEPAGRAEPGRSIRADIQAGVRFLWRHPVLRPMAAEVATSNLGASMNGPIVVLFALRELRLSAVQIGISLSFVGIGGLVATALTKRAVEHLGVGRTIAASCIGIGVGGMLIPLSHGSAASVVLILAAAYFVWGGSLTVYAVVAGSLRQTITPPGMLGRTVASANTVMSGINPLGAVLGGLLGTWLGLRPTLFLAGLLLLGSAGWILRSPVYRLRSMPEESGPSRRALDENNHIREQ